MYTELTEDFVKQHTLMECLRAFDGANGDTYETREINLNEQFEWLAKKMIYGGYIKVRNEYAIFIHTAEFYYHEELSHKGLQIKDEIVYHRNEKFHNRQVPYFPLMTLHSHWSGFDITFENPQKKYRASALIRKYAVFDFVEKKFVHLDTSGGKEIPEYNLVEEPYFDGRSTYLQFYLNGFSIDGTRSKIEWIDFDSLFDGNIKNDKPRQNAPNHRWAYYGEDCNACLKEAIITFKIQ